MKTRLLCIVSASTVVPKVKHYSGLPPVLTRGTDQRSLMGPAAYLVIESTNDSVFLYRYDANAQCVGDTWHATDEDAKSQAAYEYGACLKGWQEVPSDVADAVQFGAARLKEFRSVNGIGDE